MIIPEWIIPYPQLVRKISKLVRSNPRLILFSLLYSALWCTIFSLTVLLLVAKARSSPNFLFIPAPQYDIWLFILATPVATLAWFMKRLLLKPIKDALSLIRDETAAPSNPTIPDEWIETDHSNPLQPPVPITKSDDPSYLNQILKRYYKSHIDSIFGTPVLIIRRVDPKSRSSLNYRVKGLWKEPILLRLHQRIQNREVLSQIQLLELYIADSGIFSDPPFSHFLKPLDTATNQKFLLEPPITRSLVAAYRYADGVGRFTGALNEFKDLAFKFGKLQATLQRSELDSLWVARGHDHRAFRESFAHCDDIRGNIMRFHNTGRESDERLTNLSYGCLDILDRSSSESAGLLQELEEADHQNNQIGRPKLLYHDLHPHNAFFGDERCVLIYDYENVSSSWFESEALAFALHRFSRIRIRHLQKTGTRIDEKVVKNTITTFLECYKDGGMPEPDNFLHDLHVYIKLVNVSKFVEIASFWYYPEAYPDPAGRTRDEWYAEAVKFLSHLKEADKFRY